MGEYAAKFRPDIDLDEFERRLRAAAPAPAPQQREPGKSEARADPLAELARLVGGENTNRGGDPFEALFRAQAAIADIRHAPEDLHASHEPYLQDEGHAPPVETQDQLAEAHYAAEPESNEEAPAGWADEQDEIYAEPLDPPPPAGRSKVFFGMAAILALGVLGIGATLSQRVKTSGHEVVTIQADSDPAKVKPEQADNSGAAKSDTLFDRKDNAGAAKVVGGEEQPADLGSTVKAARVVGAAGAPAPVPAAPAPQASSAPSDSPFPAPKKVKTISVRSDGSLIQGPDTRLQQARGLPSMAGGFPAAVASPAAVSPPAKPPAAKSTARAVAALKPPPKPTQTKVAAGEMGDYAVQLAGSPVESEARAAANTLSARYASALNGRHATFVKAQVGDRTIYRVRVGHVTETSAKEMCAAIKGQGGSCFVARN